MRSLSSIYLAEHEKPKSGMGKGVIAKATIFYAAPIGAFSCPEILAFTGFGARFLEPFPKPLVTVKYDLNTKVAVNSR